MKVLRALLVTVLTVAALSASAYATGVAVRHYDAPRTQAADGSAVPTAPATSTDPTLTATPTAVPAAPPARPTPEDLLAPGATGRQVRELQARLFQLGWFPEVTTGVYDAATREGVRGFQRKRDLRGTGVVDGRTWDRLIAMTEEPTHDQLFNVLHPGPAILGPGSAGGDVRDLQARLVSIQWLFGDVTGRYDDATVQAVRGFQAKRQVPVTGEVDRRTLERLHAMTSTPTHAAMHNLGNQPGALDARCRTGRVLCIDKSSQTLRWVVDGQVLETIDVRFGASYAPTREGLFHVYRTNRDHVSSLYGSAMPFAMFFSGGQAVHYSSDFAATGYSGASHGCVNVRDYDAVAALFEQVRIGDKVIVYWS